MIKKEKEITVAHTCSPRLCGRLRQEDHLKPAWTTYENSVHKKINKMPVYMQKNDPIKSQVFGWSWSRHAVSYILAGPGGGKETIDDVKCGMQVPWDLADPRLETHHA